MKRIIPLLLAGCLLPSCAKILNRESTSTNTNPFANVVRRPDSDSVFVNILRGTQPATVIVDADTIHFNKDHRRHTIRIARNEGPKEMIIIRDTIVVSLSLRSLKTNDLGISQTIPIRDHEIDQYLAEQNALQETEEVVPIFTPSKNTIALRLGLPIINWFSSEYKNFGRRSHIGFHGIAAGVDYFYRNNTFVSASINAIQDISQPVPFAAFIKIRDNMYSVYGSVSNNHRFGRFAIGYGLSFGHDAWNTVNYGGWSENADPEDVNFKSIYRSSQSLGLVFPVHYYTGGHFFIGLVYRPMLVQFSNGAKFRYQHTFSVDLGWRIWLKK